MTPSKKQAECPHLSGGLKPTTFGYSHIAFLLLSIFFDSPSFSPSLCVRW